MNNNAKRFNVIGTIGNGSELLCVPRAEPTHGYHVIAEGEEKAIRYDRPMAWDAADRWVKDAPVRIVKKPILRQEAPDSHN